jgi:hypothetical protein
MVLAAAALACVFAGCASGTVAKDATLRPQNGKAMVLVYRTPGMSGAGTKLYLYANQQLVGGMGRGAFYSVEAAPGPMLLTFNYRPQKLTAAEWTGVALGSGGAGLITQAILQPSTLKMRSPITLNLHPNEVQYVRIDGFKLTPMSMDAGREEMKDCHWLNGASQ